VLTISSGIYYQTIDTDVGRTKPLFRAGMPAGVTSNRRLPDETAPVLHDRFDCRKPRGRARDGVDAPRIAGM
jgi:hypothetical protein